MTSEWTICVTPMPTEEALDIAARIADAEEPDCEDLLLTEGPQVCEALRCEVLHQAEVIERRTAELSTATGEVERLRARLAEMAQRARDEMGPATLRERIEMALRVRDIDPRVTLGHIGRAPSVTHTATAYMDRSSSVAMGATEHDALAALAVAVGLNADGSDPRDEIARLRALLEVAQTSLAAATSGRRVTVVDEIERLQRELASAQQENREWREQATRTNNEVAELLPDDPAVWGPGDVAYALVQARGKLAEAHAIIEGRTTPPTPAELDAHAAAGGSWLLALSYADGYRRRWKRRIETMTLRDSLPDPEAEKVRPRCSLATDHARVHEGGVGPDYREWRWWALDASARPCAWPVVEVSHG